MKIRDLSVLKAARERSRAISEKSSKTTRRQVLAVNSEESLEFGRRKILETYPEEGSSEDYSEKRTDYKDLGYKGLSRLC